MKDGGPAFPYAAWEYTGTGGETDLTHHPGAVTLRDYFAAAALHNLVGWEDGVLRPFFDAAILAYGYADAMLKERNK